MRWSPRGQIKEAGMVHKQRLRGACWDWVVYHSQLSVLQQSDWLFFLDACDVFYLLLCLFPNPNPVTHPLRFYSIMAPSMMHVMSPFWFPAILHNPLAKSHSCTLPLHSLIALSKSSFGSNYCLFLSICLPHRDLWFQCSVFFYFKKISSLMPSLIL